MYKDWENQTASSISWQLSGFALIVFGVYSLNATQGLKDSHPTCIGGLRAMCGDLLPRRWMSRRMQMERECRDADAGELERAVLLGDEASDSGGEQVYPSPNPNPSPSPSPSPSPNPDPDPNPTQTLTLTLTLTRRRPTAGRVTGRGTMARTMAAASCPPPPPPPPRPPSRV